ncbi:MAG TPA: hypothetical protein VL095_06950, partial [Flavisolibacter sp.]|nr:hypothetical protein [Flavisolibacter sp.]
DLASVGAGLGGAVFQSVSGVTVKNISEAYNYSVAYNSVFIGYGVMALLALGVVLFLMGPLVKDKKLETFVLQEEGSKEKL